MTDPLDYWQRHESKSQRVYGLSGPDGVPVDTQRSPSQQVPPRATVTPRRRRAGEPRGDEAAEAEGADEERADEERVGRAEGDGGEVNDLEADIAVERDTLATVDPDNPPA